MLYAVYSFPNIILPLMSGILLENFGVRTIIFITSILVTLGQAIFAFGVSIRSFPIALLGRGVFGCGGESLEMGQSVIIATWFEGKELSMAYTVALCTSLMGNVLNDNLTPLIVQQSGSVSFALWIGFLVCLTSLITAVFLIQLDRKRCRLMGVGTLANPDDERFRCRDVKKFKLLYWILLAYMAFLQLSVFCFNFIASGFLQNRFGFSPVESGNIMSITFFTTTFMGPLFAYIVDKKGKRPFFMIIGAVLVTFFHSALIVTPDSEKPIFVIFLFFALGFGYSLNIASAFPSLPYITDENLRGTSFGLYYSLSNLNFVIFPIVVGLIKDKTRYQDGYFWTSFFLGMLGVLGIISGVFIYFIDKNRGGVLYSMHPTQAWT